VLLALPAPDIELSQRGEAGSEATGRETGSESSFGIAMARTFYLAPPWLGLDLGAALAVNSQRCVFLEQASRTV